MGGAVRRRYNYTSKQRGERKMRKISTPEQQKKVELGRIREEEKRT